MKESIDAGESTLELDTHLPVHRDHRVASLPKCPGSQERQGWHRARKDHANLNPTVNTLFDNEVKLTSMDVLLNNRILSIPPIWMSKANGYVELTAELLVFQQFLISQNISSESTKKWKCTTFPLYFIFLSKLIPSQLGSSSTTIVTLYKEVRSSW